VNEVAHRLGLLPDARVALVNLRPETRALLPLHDVLLFERASETLDVLIYCSDDVANMRRRVPFLSGFVRSGGRIWVGHPRPGSELVTDVSVSNVVEVGTAAGLKAEDAIELGDWRLVGFLKP
jgi:hypothetical protein